MTKATLKKQQKYWEDRSREHYNRGELLESNKCLEQAKEWRILACQ